jgi:hypothetical protein
MVRGTNNKQGGGSMKGKLKLLEKMNKYCSYCGLETWACGCGGHCYSQEEHDIWKHKFGEVKQ